MTLRLTSNWLLLVVFLDITLFLNEGVLGFLTGNNYGSSSSFGQSHNPFSSGFPYRNNYDSASSFGRSHNPFSSGFPYRNSYGSSFRYGRSRNPFSYDSSSNFIDLGGGSSGDNLVIRPIKKNPFGYHSLFRLSNIGSGNSGNSPVIGSTKGHPFLYDSLFSLSDVGGGSSDESPVIKPTKRNAYLYDSSFSWSGLGSSSSSGGPVIGPTKSDLPYEDLKVLLSAPVKSLQLVSRPIFGDSLIPHKGVLATMEDGKEYLIHKGKNYGRKKGGETVITDARHMSKKWQKEGSVNYNTNKVRVTDLIKLGGKDYNLFLDNCIHAANRIVDAGNEQ